MMTGEVKSLEVTFNASPSRFSLLLAIELTDRAEFLHERESNRKSSSGA